MEFLEKEETRVQQVRGRWMIAGDDGSAVSPAVPRQTWSSGSAQYGNSIL